MRDPVLLARLHERSVKDAAGCLLWRGAKTTDGYGVIRVGSRQDASRRVARVHRLMYALAGGELLTGIEISHRCGNRACIEPSHLVAMNHAEVIARGGTGTPQKSRTRCPQGHSYTPENTRTTPVGKRVCRACDRLRKQQKRARAV